MAVAAIGMTLIMSVLLRAYWYGQVPDSSTIIWLLNFAVFGLFPLSIYNLWKIKKGIVVRGLIVGFFVILFLIIEGARLSSIVLTIEELKVEVRKVALFLQEHKNKDIQDLPESEFNRPLLDKYQLKLISTAEGEHLEILMPHFFYGHNWVPVFWESEEDTAQDSFSEGN